MNDSQHADQTFLILGASGGIGLELCRRLRRSGARLNLAGRNEESLVALAEELNSEHALVDATVQSEVMDWVKAAGEHYGRLDGIVNLVGSILLKSVSRVTEIEWREVIDLNLSSSFHVTAAASRFMRRGGSVVLMASAAARVGLFNHEAIAAAKAGVVGLAQAAAASHASRGLRFNVVAPGLVRTPLSNAMLSVEATEKASIAMHPLGRLGEPQDIASAIAWFLSPEQGWVTGQVLSVDGGISTARSPRPASG